MKIKSNLRAGSGGGSVNTGGASGGGHNSSINNTVSFYIPPVSRCVGI
jgi:hypothetical protein